MTTTVRQDIQQLRAIAVIAVIVNHLGVSWLPGGYLGVDVFFVVSGFVITNSMLSSNTQPLSRLGFFAQFWIRRVFRLWPMLFITVLGTSALLLVTGLGRPDTFITGISSLVGFANARLILGRLDYFALDTGTDWFMHTWSLAVEEQVYVTLSLIFAVLGGSRAKGTKGSMRAITAVISVLGIASLVLSFAPFTTELVRFYSPHTRLYQIGAGALLALTAARVASTPPNQSTPIKQSLVFIGLAGLFVQFFTNIAAGAMASLVSTLLTTLVLASATAFHHNSGFLPFRWIGAVGDRSYALYLVHWPAQLLATSLIDNTIGKVLFSLGLTFGLGLAGYRLIENPTRHQWRRIRARRAIGIALCGLLATLALTSASYGYVNRNSATPEVALSNAVCNQEDSSVWLIGDSHLGAIRHEIARAFEGNCAEVGGYGVILDFVDLARSPSGQRALRVKLPPLQALVDQITQHSPGVIFVVHFLSGFMADPSTAPRSADFVATEWQSSTGESVTRAEFLALFQEHLNYLAQLMASYGGSLVVTSPPPDFNWLSVDIDPQLCENGLLTMPECRTLKSEARVSRAEHRARGGEIRNVLDKLQNLHPNFIHLPLDAPFCNRLYCSNFIGGVPAYQDDDHLNFLGASLVEPLFQSVRERLTPSGPGTLICTPETSVYSCRVSLDGGFSGKLLVVPKFVANAVSKELINRVDHIDNFGSPYCVSLWANIEATFSPGGCD